MRIGYARVSTRDQSLDLQTDALLKAGCDALIFKEKATGSTRERPELQRMLGQLRQGDVVVIWKLDRLARSLADLIHLVNEIQAKGAGLLSLQDNIDTTTPSGKLTFHLFAAIAEFERDIIRERTKAGLDSARARGRMGGRPPGLTKEAQVKAAAAASLYNQEQPISQICSTLSISRKTLYKYLKIQKTGPTVRNIGPSNH